jgi:hypothetical protein
MFANQASGSVPEGWPRATRSGLVTVILVFLALLAVGLVAGAVLVALSGDVAVSALLAAAALYLTHVVGLGVSLSRDPRRGGPPPAAGVTDRGEPGLAFRFAPGPYYWLTSVLVLTSLGLLATAVAAAAGGPVGWLVAIAATAGAAFLGWYAVIVLRLAPGRLVLTPHGIYHRSLTFEHYTPWSAVYEVRAVPAEQPLIVVKAHTSDDARLRRSTDRRLAGDYEAQFLPFVAVRSLWLRSNSELAYRTFDHYLRHPEDRPELATTTALKPLGVDRV